MAGFMSRLGLMVARGIFLFSRGLGCGKAAYRPARAENFYPPLIRRLSSLSPQKR
jgi:hypothetical protein